MNKKNDKLVWTVIVVIAILLIGFFAFQAMDSDEEGDLDIAGSGEQDTTSNNLETDSQVFDEIDNSLEFID